MNNFIHNPIELPKLTRVTVDGKRLYATPSGNKYPSVTTVTSLGSEDSINAWRAKVGEEEANKISNRASGRGTRIHTLCEDYLNNKQVTPDLFDRELWKTFNPVLHNINNVMGLEIMMYSHKLEIAGTADCIADYDGVLSIIDFKTSSKPKKKEWISNYFIQAAFYAAFFLELTGIFPKQIVILIAVDDEPPMVFVENTMDWIPEAIKVRSEFRKIKGY
jgi:PD-(D/E)XK nuclease superfamily